MSTVSGGIYIHVPYCRKKCLYCDFFSGGVSSVDWSLYEYSIIQELLSRIDEIPERVESIYFGGGTPSIMPVSYLNSLLNSVKKILGNRLSVAPEVTLEINPEDVSNSTASTWRSMGFNRASLGIESFNDKLLISVGRSHSGVEAEKALDTLGYYFSNISADLIFGFPGQTLNECERDIKKLVSLKPSHISAYSLMYEPGTALTFLRDKGRIIPISDELSVEMFKMLSQTCLREGYERYEISNYSLPGMTSRHNTFYWSGAPYIGLGPSAHSYDGKRTRRANPADLKGYLKFFGKNKTKQSGTDFSFHSSKEERIYRGNIPWQHFYSEENLNQEELREEYLITRLRRKKGFEIIDYRRRFGDSLAESLLTALEIPQKRGEVVMDDGRVFLTEKGVMKSDSVILELAM